MFFEEEDMTTPASDDTSMGTEETTGEETQAPAEEAPATEESGM